MKPLLIVLVFLTLVSNANASSKFAIGECTGEHDCEVVSVSNTEKECLEEQYALVEENEDSYTAKQISEQLKEVPSLCDIKVNN